MAFPIWAAIGAGVQALGSLSSSLGGLFGSSGSGFKIKDAVVTNELQKQLFDYQFNKQLQAMNTAHQREVTDLRNAGLNPVLSATGGSGLSSPTSGMPDISSVNSAIVSSRQAHKQMIMNALTSLGDLAVRYDANRINSKSADAAADTAKANLMNASTNEVNTASQVFQRMVQNSEIDARTKKTLEEIGLVKSQQALNSALENKALTDAYYQREILPWDKYAKGTSGSVAGTMSYPVKAATDWLNSWLEKNYSTAKEKNKDWLKKHGSGFGFLGR